MRLSVKAVLIGSVVLLNLAVVGQGAVSISELSIVQSGIVDVATNWMPSVGVLGEINTAIRDTRVKLYRFVVASDEAQAFAENEKALNEAHRKLSTLKRTYETLISSPSEKESYAVAEASWSRYIDQEERIRTLMRDGRKADALALLISPEVTGLSKIAIETFTKDVELNRRGAADTSAAAVASAASAVTAAYVSTAISLVIGLGAILFSLLGVTRPIERITGAMGKLASGDATTEIPGIDRHDEIGAMAAAVQVFKNDLIRTRQLEAESALARAAAEEQRKIGMREMADRFEQEIGGIVGMVSSSSTELEATAQQMTSTAGHTAAQSAGVASAAEQAAQNVNTVAAAAEQLSSSVHEIGRQVDESASLAQIAVSEADQSAALVQELSSTVGTIGDVVTMISTIAKQTNLLALNATIEAARAGEAGRGFAVVASEVKELASQTARATEEISSQIARIQDSTGQAVQAIGGIAARIQEISGVATMIAAAVEEQGSATQEIVRNVAQAATGTSQVTSNIAGVADAAEETGSAASQVLGAASELSRQSEHLSAEVSRFLATVRAA